MECISIVDVSMEKTIHRSSKSTPWTWVINNTVKQADDGSIES